jgi:hypothetical protein
MPLKLNRVRDEVVRENLEYTLGRVRSLLAEPVSADPADRERYFHSLGRDSADAGLMLYQQEAPAREVRAHLARGGQCLLLGVLQRGRPAPGEYRGPWEFEKAVNLVVCFYTRPIRETAAFVQPWQYYYPPDANQERFVRYLEMLQGFISGTPFDPAVCRQIEAQCTSDTAPREDFVFLAAKLRGLRALEARDAPAWNQAIADLVRAHEGEARCGQYRRLPDGFLCLPALMLAQLGRERGLACSVKSPYLPLSLLEGPA